MHPGQWTVLKSKAKFKVLACGRRWGKTLLASCVALDVALRGGQVWWVAPDYPLAKKGWNMLVKMAKQMPGCRVVLGERMIITPTGGFVQCKSAVNPGSLVGEGLDLVVVDECADVAEEAWIEGLYPTLTDRDGDAMLIGTPKGRNWFYKLWHAAASGDPAFEGWEAFQMATGTNPFIPQHRLAMAERYLSKRVWDQEYMARFVSFEGRVYDTFDPDGPMVFDKLDRSRYKTYFGGIDVGFTNPTAMVVAGEDDDGRLDCIEERYERRLRPQQIIDLVVEMTEEYDITQWWVDPAKADIIAELQDLDLPVEAAPSTSGGQESRVQWEVRLTSGRLENPDGPTLRFYKPGMPETIKEHDEYRYPKIRTGAPLTEKPLKVNDHSCNAVQYMVHGLHRWYGFGDNDFIVSGEREAHRLPG